MTFHFFKKRITLRFKFILLLVGITIVPLLVTLGILVARIQNMQRESAIEQSQQKSHMAAEELRTFLLSWFGMLENAGALYGVLSTAEFQTSYLPLLLSRNQDLIEITVLNDRGKELVRRSTIRVFGPGDLEDLSTSEEYLSALKNNYYIGPVVPQAGRNTFIIGQSILAPDGTFHGALLARLDTRVLQDIIARMAGIGQQSEVYIVNKDGTVIAQAGSSRSLGARASDSKIVEELLTGKSDEHIGRAYSREDGAEVLGGGSMVLISSGMPGEAAVHTGWYVIAEEDAHIAVAGVAQTKQFALILLIAIFILSIGSSAVFAGRIAGPIEELHRASKLFAEGNLQHRVVVDTGDEIQDLADEFNIMAGELSHSIAALRKDSDIITAERNKLEAILSGISDAVIAVDGGCKIVLFNKTAEDLTGLHAPDVVGKPIGAIMKFFDNEKELPVDRYCPVEENSEGIVFTRSTIRILTAQKEFFANVLVEKISRGISRDAVSCIVTLHDISRDQLIERMKTEFVSVVAHQLRTPLTGIKWSIKMLLNKELGPLPVNQEEVLSRTYQSTERMITLINNLLDVTRIEEGRYVYKPMPSDIAQLLREVIERERAWAQERGVHITENISSGMSELQVDADAIMLALKNLLKNAILYTPAGGSVAVAACEREGAVEILVTDTGVGIGDAEKSRIFSKFFRGAHALRMQTEGSGLGLFIAKNIVEAHHGTLWFESVEGTGTTFTISIPIS